MPDQSKDEKKPVQPTASKPETRKPSAASSEQPKSDAQAESAPQAKLVGEPVPVKPAASVKHGLPGLPTPAKGMMSPLPAPKSASDDKQKPSDPGQDAASKAAPESKSKDEAPAFKVIDSSEAASEDQPAAEPAAAKPAPEPDNALDQFSPAAPSPTPTEMYRALGLAVAFGGFGLAAAPYLSGQAAEMLKPLGNTMLPACTLIICGLVLFGVGVLRRTLFSIRGEVEYIANETPFLGQIADQGRALQREFADVETALGASREDMRTLQGFVEQLMELATNPEFEVSLFRMAASLDQLGARLDVTMKDRLDTVQERLGSLKETTQRSTEDVTLGLKSLEKRMHEHDASLRQGESETRDQIEVSASVLQERIDQGNEALARFGADVGRIQSAVSTEVAQQLSDLREHLARTVKDATEGSGEQFEQCAQTIAGIGGEISRLEDALAQSFGQQLGELREQVVGTVQASNELSGEQLEQCARTIADFGSEFGRLESALAQNFEQQLGDLHEQVASTVRASDEHSGEQLEQCTQAISGFGTELGRLESALAQNFEQQLGDLREQVASTVQASNEHSSEQLEQCTQAISGMGGEFGRLEGALAQNFEQQLGDLREQVASTVKASSFRSGERFDQCMQAISGLGEGLQLVQSALVEGVAGFSEESSRAAQQVATDLADLSHDLTQAVAAQHASIGECLSDLESKLTERASEVRELGQVFEAQTEQQSANLDSAFLNHHTQVEQTIGQHCGALADDLTAIAELVCEMGSQAEAAQATEMPEATPAAEATPVSEPSAPQAWSSPATEPQDAKNSAFPFGHDVPSVADADAIQAPLPNQNGSQPKTPAHDEYPIERLGREFDDGWTDG